VKIASYYVTTSYFGRIGLFGNFQIYLELMVKGVVIVVMVVGLTNAISGYHH